MFVKDEMSECEMYDVELTWSTLKRVLLEARRVLPLKVEQKSGDWVTEDVCKISDEKRRAWLTWRNDPLVMSFRMEYMRLKALSKRKVAEAKEKWWSEQVKLIGDAFEDGLRNGKSGSVLKDLKRLRNGQCLSHTSVIVDKNVSKLLSTKEQLVRWREYFEELLNVSRWVDPSMIESVPVWRIWQQNHLGVR